MNKNIAYSNLWIIHEQGLNLEFSWIIQIMHLNNQLLQLNSLLYYTQVEVTDGDDTNEVKEILKEGSCFGQKSLLYNTPMDSSARAVTHVDMFTFSQADFEHVLKDHATMAALISDIAEREYGTPAYFAHWVSYSTIRVYLYLYIPQNILKTTYLRMNIYYYNT